MKVKFTIGQIVYLITDIEQLQRVVTGYVIRKDSVMYELSCGLDVSNHYDCEISDIKSY